MSQESVVMVVATNGVIDQGSLEVPLKGIKGNCFGCQDEFPECLSGFIRGAGWQGFCLRGRFPFHVWYFDANI